MTPSSRELKHISKALEVSTASDVPRTKIGAVIAHGNKIVSQACNVTKTHPEQQRWHDITNSFRPKACLHAELGAILKAGTNNILGATIYVARWDRNGRQAIAKPCRSCARAIEASGIARVVYTTPNGIREYRV